MPKLIRIPHEVHESTCYVNGLYDVLTWKGCKVRLFPVTHHWWYGFNHVSRLVCIMYLMRESSDPVLGQLLL